MTQLTEQQAYLAMFAFVERQYHGGAEELGALLGSLALMPDGSPADPAYKAEWSTAVQQALTGQVFAELKLSPTAGSSNGKA
jgi:hypothetical protein